MRAALLKAKAKKKKFLKRQKEEVPEYDSDESLSSDDEEAYSQDMVGMCLHNKYLIVKYIGRGSFSKVWLVLEIGTENFYSLKIQEPNDLDEIEDEIRFLKMIQKKYNSEYKNDDFEMVNMIDEFSLKLNGYETHAIVMNLLGGNIGDIIGDIPEDCKLDVIKNLIRNLVSGLDKLHSLGIVHTDMKVDNILLNQINPELNEYIKRVKELNICQKFNTLYTQNIPKEINLLDKKKRKVVKKKIKTKVMKEVVSSFYDKINELKNESQNNLKLEIQEIEEVEDEDENNEDEENRDDKEMNNLEEQDSIENPALINYDWNKLSVKLIDFGNADMEGDMNIGEEMYIRSYRPPENIIQKVCSTQSDIWFVGCLLYELLTEEILFDIDSIDKLNRDKEHLKMMHQYLGHIPRNMLVSHQLSEEVLDFDRYEINSMSLRDNILENNEIEENELDLIEDLLYKILEYDPEKRIKARDILNHRWLKA